MAEGLLIQPPEIVEMDGPVIFIAGPIQGAPNWHTEAASMIHSQDSSIVVASPRRDYPKGTFVYEKQVDWETHYLRRAAQLGVIAFWLAAQAYDTPGRAYAQTSRVEIGEWMARCALDPQIKLTVGIEEGFGNARYISRRFGQECPQVRIVDDLGEMCKNAVDLAHGSVS